MLIIFTQQKYEIFLMIAKFFNKTKPLNNLILTIVLIIFFGIALFSVSKNTLDLSYFLKNISSFILIFLTLFLIRFIVKKNGLSKDNSYVILLLVLYFGMFPLALLNLKLLITHFILLLALRRIYSIRTGKNTIEKILDSSFWIGIMTLIYPLSIVFIILVYTAIYVFRKLTIRNFIIPIVGVLAPILIYGVYLFVIDDLNSFMLYSKPNFSYLDYNSLQLLIPIALLFGLLLWIVPTTTIKTITTNFEYKSIWFLLLVHVFISILYIIPSTIKNGSEFLFLFFPIVIIFTHYLELIKEKWFKEVFLLLFFIVTISIYFL